MLKRLGFLPIRLQPYPDLGKESEACLGYNGANQILFRRLLFIDRVRSL
jgi:hypothetical protein